MVNTILARRVNHIVAKGDNPAWPKGSKSRGFSITPQIITLTHVFSNVLPKMTTVDVICYKYKPLKTGELPLKIKVCKDRKTRYINLGVSTKAEYWDFEKNQPKSNCPDREMLEKLISNKISEVKSKIVELKSENKEFSATTLVDKVSSPVRLVTIGELFKQYLSRLEDEKRTGYRLSIQQTYW